MNLSINRWASAALKLRLWFIVSLIMLLIITSGCRNPALQSAWTERTIIIDGKNLEWDQIPVYKPDSWAASLKLCNDNVFLYLLVTLEDPLLVSHAENRGLALEFSSPASKEPMFSFYYTGIDPLHRYTEIKDSFWEYLTDGQQKRLYQQQEIMQNMITVIQNGQTIRISPNGEQGLAAARNSNQGNITYEFRIPLNINERYKFTIHAVADKPLGITIGLAELAPEVFQGYPAAPLQSGPSGRSLQRPLSQMSDIHLRVLLAKSE